MAVNQIVIAAKSLASRKVREATGKVKKIDFAQAISKQNGKEGFLQSLGKKVGGFIDAMKPTAGFLWNLTKKVGGFLWNLIVTPVWNWMCDKAQDLWYFDWNQSDEDLRRNVQSAKINLLRSLGGLVGSGAAWVVSAAVGYGLSMAIPVFGSKLLARYVVGELGQEALRDLGSKASSVWNNVVYLGLEYVLTETYIGLRSGLRNGQNWLVNRFFGEAKAKEISDNLNANRNKPWSFAIEYERRIESIKSPELRAFVEGLADGGSDVFIEAGYVIGESITDYINNHQALEGDKATIEIYPDKDSEEKLILEGGQNQLVIDAENVINQSRILGNRDLGYIFDGGNYVQQPLPGFQSRCLHVKFTSKKEPPMPWGDKEFQMVELTIPHLKKSLTWEAVKTACRPWNYGKVACVARLDTGNKMTVWASSENEAEGKINELLEISTAKVLTTTFHRQGKQPKERIRRNVRVYPYKASLILQTPDRTGKEGWTDIEGKKHKRAREPFVLYPDKKPEKVPKEL